MKNFITLLIAFFSATCVLISQTKVHQDNITISNPYKVVDAKQKHYFQNGEEILSVKIHGKIAILQKFKIEGLKFIKQTEYKDLPKGFSYEGIEEFNSKYYLFYSVWDKNNEKEQLFAREIDFEKGEFVNNGKLIVKVNGRITGSPLGFVNGIPVGVKYKFNQQLSNDKSKILIQYRLKPKIKNDAKNYDKIGLFVFDNNLNKIWGNEIKMPYTEKKMNNIDYSIDSEGNAYILTTVFKDNTTKKYSKDGSSNYHIELLRIKANTDHIDITKIELGDKFINRIWLNESSNENMICAGFYNDGKRYDNANGIFLFKVKNTGEAYDINHYEIPVEILNQYVSNKTKKKNTKKDNKDKAEFEDLELRQLTVNDDGSIILIGEQFYIQSHTSTSVDGRSTITYHTYHYNDILIIKIGTDNELEWMRKLPKRQIGTKGKGGMSYKYISDNNNHYLVFLDNLKNLNLSMDMVPAEHRDGAGGFLTAYKIDDSDGVVEKLSIFDTRKVKGIPVYQFLTNRIIPLSDGSFLVEAYKKKKEDILIKVKLN